MWQWKWVDGHATCTRGRARQVMLAAPNSAINAHTHVNLPKALSSTRPRKRTPTEVLDVIHEMRGVVGHAGLNGLRPAGQGQGVS